MLIEILVGCLFTGFLIYFILIIGKFVRVIGWDLSYLKHTNTFIVGSVWFLIFILIISCLIPIGIILYLLGDIIIKLLN